MTVLKDSVFEYNNQHKLSLNTIIFVDYLQTIFEYNNQHKLFFKVQVFCFPFN